MLTARYYRLYPSAEQRSLIDKHFGCVRVVYNKSLEYSQDVYHKTGKMMSTYDLINQLPRWKEELPYLKAVNAQCLQQSVINFCAARYNFFKHKKGYPRFKNKHAHQSARFPHYGRVDERNQTVFVQVVGMIPAIIHRPVDGEVRSITLTKNTIGQYHASVLVKTGIAEPKANLVGKAIGIDLGITDFLVTSDGDRIPNPKHFKKHQKNLKRKQQKLARCKKDSNRRKKAKRLVSKIHLKVVNQRKDFIHKLSRQLINENQIVVFENLAIKNMVKNRHLANAISTIGWGMLISFCRYKARQDGKAVLRCDRSLPSSKMCSACLAINHELKLLQRVWTCVSCHTIHDRDQNAAINVLKGKYIQQHSIAYLVGRNILKRA